ncbi:MAG TPA: hypothetical protein VGR27_02810 [Longimicrobiaceae bacterium]|nr:hypothetical protein [Longimicrobiaceae bacterium]
MNAMPTEAQPALEFHPATGARGGGVRQLPRRPHRGGVSVEPRKDRMPDVFAWTGLASTFRKAGFVEVARRAETRPVMRWFATAG